MKKPMKYQPLFDDDKSVNQAIQELKHVAAFGRFTDAIHDLREQALTRLWDDNVVANDRVSLAYQIEARVYQDILNRIQDAGDLPEDTEQS